MDATGSSGSLRWSLATALAALPALHNALPALKRFRVTAVKQFKKAFAACKTFRVVFDLFEHAQALF